MKPKMMVKISIDFVMTILLLLLMARQITGEAAHEWLGAGMFILWVVHHILNFKWHGNLFKGKYTPFRMVQVIVNLLPFLSMLGTMVSAVILSREVFAFLPLSGGIALARPMHIFCSFLGGCPDGIAFGATLEYDSWLGAESIWVDSIQISENFISPCRSNNRCIWSLCIYK